MVYRVLQAFSRVSGGSGCLFLVFVAFFRIVERFCWFNMEGFDFPRVLEL